MTRTFTDAPATRGPTPLLFGIIGPSGSGKTYSALRIATGIERVSGGPIYFIDTESSRALHYADKFNFRHVPFTAPFSPLDYLEVLEYCIGKGAKIIVADSFSHEHDGPGGVLEWHSAETERLMQSWKVTADKAQIPAWAKPKAARRKLINAITQMPAHMLFCFRAKEKVKLGNREVTNLGFMPIAGEEYVYEMTAKALLLPGAAGVPTWQPENPGEKLMTKLPEQFRAIFSGRAGKPLDEDTGEAMARWAAGNPEGRYAGRKFDEPMKTTGTPLADQYAACEDEATYMALEVKRKEVWSLLPGPDKQALKAASAAAANRVIPPDAGELEG